MPQWINHGPGVQIHAERIPRCCPELDGNAPPDQFAAMEISCHQTRGEMGSAAAKAAADALRSVLARQPAARMIFAAAPSQSDMLACLIKLDGIDWPRVSAFHMDEYIGLPAGAPERFAAWLDRNLFRHVPFSAVRRLDPGSDPERAAARYAAELAELPIDIVCLGIGVNGHIAFNDPPVADFNDPLDVKIVALDEICRQQQVDDKCFAELAAVPTHALTLTVPRLLRASKLICVVPGAQKREAVRRTLYGPVGAACPATALRSHPDCALYLDADSNPND